MIILSVHIIFLLYLYIVMVFVPILLYSVFRSLSKQWNGNIVMSHHKILKQWNEIAVPFRSVPFCSIPLRSVTFHQFKESLRTFLNI